MNSPLQPESQRLGPGLPAWAALSAAAALLAAACASTPAPTADVAVSTAAVEHAVGAGAPQWAPTEMRSARDKLERANAAMTAKDYAAARVFAQQAEVDARLAESKAESAKTRKAADELQDSNRVLREEMNRKPQ